MAHERSGRRVARMGLHDGGHPRDLEGDGKPGGMKGDAMAKRRIRPDEIRRRLGFAGQEAPAPPPATCSSCGKPRILPGPDGRCAVCKAMGKPAPAASDGSPS
jgi:hypothetical protein